jgi:hypothetical protein
MKQAINVLNVKSNFHKTLTGEKEVELRGTFHTVFYLGSELAAPKTANAAGIAALAFIFHAGATGAKATQVSSNVSGKLDLAVHKHFPDMSRSVARAIWLNFQRVTNFPGATNVLQEPRQQFLISVWVMSRYFWNSEV